MRSLRARKLYPRIVILIQAGVPRSICDPSGKRRLERSLLEVRRRYSGRDPNPGWRRMKTTLDFATLSLIGVGAFGLAYLILSSL